MLKEENGEQGPKSRSTIFRILWSFYPSFWVYKNACFREVFALQAKLPYMSVFSVPPLSISITLIQRWLLSF